ncbi:MAG: alkaline phosphatase D family protein [Thermoleophilaceae bacterium]|nr:alkaline phosphatase D family protein [Thermoleophilaceae bacterium]
MSQLETTTAATRGSTGTTHGTAYPVARQRLIDHLVRARVRNPLMITGDWHSTFVNDIKLDFSNPDSSTGGSGARTCAW